MRIEGLDDLDNKILDVIKENARLTFSEIGEKCGVSRVSVKNRMEILEQKGIIQGYHTVIDPTRVPEGWPDCIMDMMRSRRTGLR